jgi:hypothetical protein
MSPPMTGGLAASSTSRTSTRAGRESQRMRRCRPIQAWPVTVGARQAGVQTHAGAGGTA